MTCIRFPALHAVYMVCENKAQPGFRTGTPVPAYGTTALGGYHAYKSLVWVDSAALSQAL